MKKHKRAQEGRTLIIIIIIIAAALVLISFGSKIYAGMVEHASDDACRLSLLAKARTKELDPITKTSPLSAECPRKKIVFYDDHVEKHVKGSERTIEVNSKKRFKGLTEDIVFRVLGEELRSCWYKTLEGKMMPFDADLINLVGVDNVCLICATVEFDGGLRGRSTPYIGFNDYLSTTDMTNSDTKYSDYLTTDVYGQKLSIIIFLDKRIDVDDQGAVESVDEFSTDESYSIVYTAFTEARVNILGFIGKNFARLYSIISGKTVGKKTFGLLSVIKSEDISSLKCNVLYN